MSNKIITPAEFAQRLVESMRAGAANLPPEKRREFYGACASWLSGGVYR